MTTTRSFLYRGTQLAAIQQAAAVVSRPGRYPALTPTQRGFLHASDRAAARSTRQRRALSAVAGPAAHRLARRCRPCRPGGQNANQQRKNAVSGQLAAQSEALDTTEPVIAAQLAAAAWRIAHYAWPARACSTSSLSPTAGVLLDRSQQRRRVCGGVQPGRQDPRHR